MPFLQKKSVQLTFSSLRTANCKVPSRIGGHHFLLCQQTNTKDIAGQSANDDHDDHDDDHDDDDDDDDADGDDGIDN